MAHPSDDGDIGPRITPLALCLALLDAVRVEPCPDPSDYARAAQVGPLRAPGPLCSEYHRGDPLDRCYNLATDEPVRYIDDHGETREIPVCRWHREEAQDWADRYGDPEPLPGWAA